MNIWETRRTGLAVAISLLLMASVAGCLSDDDENNGNGNGGDGEVLANAGPDVIGEAGEPVTFNGSASSGKIERYWWDVDRGNASDALNEDLVGEVVEHTYGEPGVYVVTLTVEGKKDQESNDTLTARIDLLDSQTGTIENVEAYNQTYNYTVKPEVQKIALTVTYPTTAGSPIPLPVFLDMDLYAGGQQPIATTTSQTPDPGDTQTETLDLDQSDINDVVANGGFKVVIRWQQPPVGTVTFDLAVNLYYHAV